MLFPTNPILDCFLVQPVWRVASNQANQQRDNIPQERLARIQFHFGKQFLDEDEIQTAGTFQCRAAGDVEEFAPISRGEPTIAFGNVQNDRGSCPIELVLDGGRFG